MGAILTSTLALTARLESEEGYYIGLTWYDETRKSIAYFFGNDRELFASFLASTSANSAVKGNLTLAIKAYKQFKRGEPFNGFMGQVINNLNRSVNSLPLHGRKIENFRLAILGDINAVVIDRWILKAYNVKGNLNSFEYNDLSNVIRKDAAKVNLTPVEYQAILWVKIKRRAGDIQRYTDKSFGSILNSKGYQLDLF